MSETGQVIGESSPECGPSSLLSFLSCPSHFLPVVRLLELLARHVHQCVGQFHVFTRPLCQIVERLLGLDRCTVEAEQKCQGGWIIASLEKCVVDLGKEEF